MFVVPVRGDTIQTTDGGSYTVLEFTNLKQEGPAVYVEQAEGEPALSIYFFDINHINDVKVKFQTGPKVFKSLGHLNRKFHLPQPHDTIVVPGPDEGTTNEVVVVKLKLHAKDLGLSGGLFLLDAEKHKYHLSDIIDLQPAVGGEHFNRKKFLAYYKDYLGTTWD